MWAARIVATFCFLAFLACSAYAQTPNPVTPGYQICNSASGSTQCSFQPVDLTHGLPVNLITGSVTASLAPFGPSAAGSRMTPLTVTTSDSSGTLPTGAATVVTNVGTNPMYCNTAGVAATTSDQYISASGGWFVFVPAPAVTTLRCIATGGSTTANGQGGTGLPAGTGGGSGGGGGGGTSSNFGSAFPTPGTAIGFTDGTNMVAGKVRTPGSGATTADPAVVVVDPNVLAAINSPIPGGTNTIGKVGIDQTTPGTTNLVALAANQSVNTAQVNGVAVLTGTGATGTGAQRVTVSTDQATNAGAALKNGGVGVVNGASTYNTIAASQTSQIMSATNGGTSGTTGDYLSHCVLQPTTTGASNMTISDNSTVVFTFTTGTLSNLAPIAIPIGAVSVSGGWKITTGANESATCFGKFT